MNLENFIDDLASKSPAPGGGAASSLFGTLGCALSAMVCCLTEGRKKYVDNEEFVKVQHEKLSQLQKELQDLMDEDVNAFMQISAAYKLPKETEEEKVARSVAIQEALIPATETPFKMMQLSAKALDITKSLLGKTNTQAVSDLGCAALGLKAAIQGAWLNVSINISSAKNKPVELETEAKEILSKYLPLADDIYNKVLESL